MIIAEIGQNHNGDMQLACKLINLAKENGADLVKFQLYSTEGLQRTDDTLRALKKSELSKLDAQQLFNWGKAQGIEVFFSVFDTERVKWCEDIGVNRYKIASTMNDDSVLNAVRATGKDVIESTQKGRRFIYPTKALYCPAGYPQTDIQFSNLNWADGFSDHTIGINHAKIALARGTSVVEKHFCIDHKTGIDSEWSMTPNELRELKRFELVCKQAI